ncbi:MAG: hypothetical protein HYZ69_01630 [Candidatus Colwellbacteria bacterium]|nr:hypothetical protein [Candidatus Colwellbacteria bacterium]
MLNIPREKVLERWDKLPLSIKEAMFSEENADIIERIGKENNLTDTSLQILITVTGDALRGFINQDELTGELINELGVDRGTVEKVANIIKEKIFAPIREDLKGVYEPLIEFQRARLLKLDTNLEQLASTTMSTISIPEQLAPHQTIKPSFENSPFILHQEEEIVTEEHQAQQYAAPRPVFYKPTFSEEYKRDAAPPTAKLELGPQEEGSGKEPRLVRTPLEETRIVHYSELVTPVDPFGSQEQMPAAAPAMPTQKNDESKKQSPEVHPNNIVDLKDLPL